MCSSCKNGDSQNRQIHHEQSVDVCFDFGELKLGQSYKRVTKILNGKYNKDDLTRDGDIAKTINTYDTLYIDSVEIPYSLYLDFDKDFLIELTIYFDKNLTEYQNEQLKEYVNNECKFVLEDGTIHFFERYIVKVYLGENSKGQKSSIVSFILK